MDECTYSQIVLLSFWMSCPSGTWPRVSRIMMSFKGAPMVSMEHWFNSSSNFWRQALGALPGPTRGWPVHTAWYDAIMFWSVWPTMNCSCFVHSLASDCKPPDAQPTMTCCVGLLKYDTDLNFNFLFLYKSKKATTIDYAVLSLNSRYHLMKTFEALTCRCCL